MVVINPKKMNLTVWLDEFKYRRDELKSQLEERLEHALLFGRYYLGKKIGSGGFGTVFELIQSDKVKPSSVVKIILIPNDSEAEEIYNTGCNDGNMNEKLNEIVCRVSNEVKLLEQFRGHENIVTIMGSDKIKISRTFFAILIQIEYLTPMINFFNSQSYLNEKNVIMLGINICSAIEELNKSNVLHRDIKPGNIFVNNSGIFQLGDFGIARHVRETTDITRIGTYGYIAPEVLLGHGVGVCAAAKCQ